MSDVANAAGGFIDAMKSQPLALALCVMNLALLALMFYQSKGYADARQASIEMVLDYQKEMQKLLAHCAGPRSELPPEEQVLRTRT